MTRKNKNDTGLLTYAGRFITGQEMGDAHGDATFFADGVRDKPRWWGRGGESKHLAGWKRLGLRVVAVAVAYGLVTHRELTEWLLVLTFGTLGGVLMWVTVRKLYAWHHDREYVVPFATALGMRLDIPSTTKPSEWLKIPGNFMDPDAQIIINPPHGVIATDQDKQVVLQAVTAKLGISEPKADWSRLNRSKPEVIISHRKPPPAEVLLADVQRAIDQRQADELVLGRTEENALVKVSLRMESPHGLMSIGSGGGKSVAAELIGAQVLHTGGNLLIFDFPKLVSLPAFRRLPNAAYCDSAALVHAGGVWLAKELERRAMLVKQHTDFEGVYRGPELTRLMVICEEANALMNRLKRIWQEIREKTDSRISPALDGIELSSLMGRQLFITLLVIGQYATVSATGSGKDGASRESMGIRLLGRASPQNWKNIAPEHPYPGRTTIPGRVHVVIDDCRETQLVNIRHREAREMALSGIVTPCPVDMPGVTVTGDTPVLPGPDQGLSYDRPTPVPELPPGMKLSELFADGYWPGTWEALKRASHRKGFPAYLRMEDGARVYDPDDVEDFVATAAKRRRSA